MDILRKRRFTTLFAMFALAVGSLTAATHLTVAYSAVPPVEPSKTDRLRGEAEYWQTMLQDEHGQIPPDGLMRAKAQVNRMRQAQQGMGPEAAGITRDTWTSLGPGGVGGAVSSLVFNPTDPNRIWAGTAGGGIWTTTDGGKAWKPVNDFLVSLAVSAMVMNPQDPKTIYAGTGQDYSGDANRGAGIFKTTDGGVTWNQLASTANLSFSFVRALAISNDGSTLLSATSNGFGGGAPGIFRSTDGGATWTKTLESPAGTFDNLDDVQIHPTDKTRAVAASHAGRAWYSTDGGVTWTAATGLPTQAGRIKVAYAPSSPNIVYANVYVNRGELWKSTDGGATYQLANTGNGYLGTQGWIHTALWVDPTNAQNLVVGGLTLWSSTNGGTTLTRLTSGRGGSVTHPDQRVIVSPPNYNGTTVQTIYVGNDGGISRGNPFMPGAAWEDLNNNLGITQFYGMAGNPTTGVVVAGAQDNQMRRFSGDPQKWTAWAGGDGGYAAADPTDPNYFYGEYTYLTISRSSTGADCCADDIYGQTDVWNGTGWTTQKSANPISDAINQKANFIAPFILDPNEPNRLLGGGASLWRSNNAKKAVKDGGPDWAAIQAPTGTDGRSYISAIAVAPGNSDLIYNGRNDGSIYKTVNGTAATPVWIQVVNANATAPLPARKVTRITIDPTTNNTVYATYGGFAANNVWKSTDGGVTWAPIPGTGAGTLPAIPVYSLQVGQKNANWLYVGTELGVFTSEDGGNTWTIPQDGPANVRVTELTYVKDALYAATYGRGVFRAGIGTGTLPCFTLTANPQPAASGTITANTPPNCNGTQYRQGTQVSLTAAPNNGFGFQNWTGDVTPNPATTANIMVTMDKDKTVTANFSANPVCYTLTLTPFPAEGGTITAVPPPNCNNGSQYTAGTVVGLTANANNGFGFGAWGVDAVGNDPRTTITMDNDKQAGVTFAAPAPDIDSATVALPIQTGVGVYFPLTSRAPATGSPAPSQAGGVRPAHTHAQAANTFTYEFNTRNITDTAQDPAMCNLGTGGKDVWFKYTAAQKGTLHLDTFDSSYPTIMQVYTGSADNLTTDMCDDDENVNDPGPDHPYFDPDTMTVSVDELSSLDVPVQAGQTYYVEIGDGSRPPMFEEEYDTGEDTAVDPEGGLLVLHVRLDPVTGALAKR